MSDEKKLSDDLEDMIGSAKDGAKKAADKAGEFAEEAKEKARKQKVIDDRAERKRLKELEKYKGKTKDEIKQMKRRDSIVDTNKSDQVKSLINLGLTKKEIKEIELKRTK